MRVTGTRAGGLDAGSVIGAGVPIRRGGSYMIALSGPKNVGHSPILIESVTPQTTSPLLRATIGHIYVLPKPLPHLIALPGAWPGWPPRRLPKSSMSARSVVSLPTSRTIYPGREAEFVYGIFLRGGRSSKLRITSLRITFKERDRTYVWTPPQPVSLVRPRH